MILSAADPAAIRAAADAIRAGSLIGLPTETVYGLGADADNAAAVAQVFATKGVRRTTPHRACKRPRRRRLGVAHFATAVPDFAQRLMAAFWPGALTLILPRRPGIGTAAAGGQDSIGLRCPAHPAAQAVLHALRARAMKRRLRNPWFGALLPQRQPLWPRQPHHHGPCARRTRHRLAGAGRRAVQPGHRIHHHRLHARRVLLRPGTLAREQIERTCGCRCYRKKERNSEVLRGLTAPKLQEPWIALRSNGARAVDGRPGLQAAVDMLGTVMLPGGSDATASIAIYARTPLKRCPGRHAAPHARRRRRHRPPAFAVLRAWMPPASNSSGWKRHPSRPSGKACAIACSGRPLEQALQSGPKKQPTRAVLEAQGGVAAPDCRDQKRMPTARLTELGSSLVSRVWPVDSLAVVLNGV